MEHGPLSKIVFATHLNYWQQNRGAHLRIGNMIRWLGRAGHEVVVFYTGPRELLDATAADICAVVTPSDYAPKNRMRLAMLRLRGWWDECANRCTSILAADDKLPKGVRSWKSFISEVDKYAFDAFLEDSQPDVIIIEYIWLTRLIAKLPANRRKRSKVVLDSHDVIHIRTSQFLANKQVPVQGATLAEEREALAHYDSVIAIQDRDREQLQKLVPTTPVITVKHSHNLSGAEPKGRIDATCHVLFVGAKNAPNMDALRQFLTHVWPLLEDKYGSRVKLWVVGSVCEYRDQLPPASNLVFQGVVDNLDKYYRDASFIIAPLTYGTGLKIKVVEALCYGKPLITTSIGAEGLETGINKAFLVTDEWTDFYDKCQMLVDNEDRLRTLAVHAYQYAQREFSADAVYRPLAEHLGLASGRPNSDAN